MGTKKECAKCGQLRPIGKLIIYRTTGEKRCRQCIHRFGQNPFFEPKIKGAKKERKFIKMTLKPEEKIEIYKSLVKIGIDSDTASRRISHLNNYQYWIQRKRMLPDQTEEGIDRTKFMEGLK